MLKAQENLRFQAQLLNAVQQAVMAIDLEGKIIFWNRFAESLYGWLAEEAVGQSAAFLIPAASQEQEGAFMARLRQGESWEGEFTVQRRDGSTFTALVTDSPIFDEQGVFVGMIRVSRNVTAEKMAQKALSESEERYRLLVELSPVPIGLYKDNTVFFANQAVASMLG